MMVRLVGYCCVILTLFTAERVEGYKDGATSAQCADMVPEVGYQNHGHPQSTAMPYLVELSSTTYSSSQQLTVTLRGEDSTKTFKGFLIIVKDAAGAIVGSFTGPTNGKTVCANNGGFTHNDDAVKSQIVMTWTAPREAKGNLYVTVTVVKIKNQHWDAKKAVTISQDSGAVFPTTSPDSTTAAPQQGTFVYDTDCGVARGCLANCKSGISAADESGEDKCTGNHIVTWQQDGEKINFKISGKMDLDRYIAIALSNDDDMGDDTVLACAYGGGEAQLIQAYNPPEGANSEKPATIASSDIADIGLTIIGNSYENGIIKCEFSKQRGPTGNNKVFDVDTNYYLLFAKGPFSGSIREHDEDYHTEEKVDFNKYKKSEVPTPPTTPLTTRPQTPAGTLSYDQTCGTTTHGCFHDCGRKEAGKCSYIVRWRDAGDSIEFTLSATLENNRYIAIGFSVDNKMGDDSVIMCGTNGDIWNSFNTGTRNNALTSDVQAGLSSKSTNYTDGVLVCSFVRQTTSADTSKLFDLNTEYFMMVATGPLPAGSGRTASQHDSNPEVSPSTINLKSANDLSRPTISTTPQPQTPAGTLGYKKECGSSTGCFHNCDKDGKCSRMVQWRNIGDSIEFTVSANLENNRYIAIGFSTDDQMGDDYVIMCGTNGAVWNSFNTGNNKENKALTSPDDQAGLSNIACNYADGVLVCRFTRQKKLADTSKIFDLNNDYFMMVATGGLGAGSGRKKRAATATPNRHETTPDVSSSTVDLQSVQDLSIARNFKKERLLKAHACLMIFAWVCAATIGIVVALYYKLQWPNTRVGGLHVWFQLHRACMILVFLASCAGFVIIFIREKEWSDMSFGHTVMRYHPIFGTVCVGLTIINPIMAAFRCGPKDSKRPIFNFFHWVVGVGAHALGIVAIFGGIDRPSTLIIPEHVEYIMYGFVGWYGFVSLILAMSQCCEKGGKSRSEAYEMSNPSNHDDPRDKVETKSDAIRSFRQFIFVINLLVCIGLAAAMIVILLLENKERK